MVCDGGDVVSFLSSGLESYIKPDTLLSFGVVSSYDKSLLLESYCCSLLFGVIIPPFEGDIFSVISIFLSVYSTLLSLARLIVLFGVFSNELCCLSKN